MTVVPFARGGNSDDVLISAKVDGYSGIFELDTGNPGLILSAFVLRSSAAGGIDTVRDQREAQRGASQVHIHEVHIGTIRLTDFTAPLYPGLPVPSSPVNAILARAWVRRFMLGNIGLAVLESFETIIDYPRRRIVLIRLDRTGHRLVNVPAYTPAWSAPLIDVGDRPDPSRVEPWHWWGVRAQVRHIDGLWMIDTETSDMSLIDGTVYPDQVQHLPLRGTGRLSDPLVIAGRPFDLGDSVSNDAGTYGNVLGGPFLRQLGVVGFNRRAHQFLTYRVTQD